MMQNAFYVDIYLFRTMKKGKGRPPFTRGERRIYIPRKKIVNFHVSIYFPSGVTKHRNGMERTIPEYTGTRQNDAGMKRK